MSSDAGQLGGDRFANALVSGIHRVIARQEHLNHINVFPVADSDTGTNLSLSLSSAIVVLQSGTEKPLGPMLASLADALLDGARGNSGAIVAQFFQGMSDSAGEATHISSRSFARAVSLGSEYAHDALSNPREGTILSVIAAFAQSLAHHTSDSNNRSLAEIVKVARKKVDEALAETPNQLDVLKKAGVVDAGAMGFAELVAGMSDYFETGVITAKPDSSLLDNIEAPLQFSEDDNASHYRYCTECLVTATDIDRRKLREALSDLGDSLVLAGSKRKAKIHIHVDDPDAVFELARQHGDVSGEKADDMHRQQHATHGDTRGFAVITDSGADISDEDMERLDIHMVPCRIQFGERGFLDKLSITTEEFYSELRSNPHHPTTSQPAPGDFRRQFQFLASHFSDVLSINLTSAASGTYEGARAAALRANAPGRIHVVDSLNASTGQGLLAVLAGECAAAGVSVEKTVRIIEAEVAKTRTFAILQDLRYAVRGGRLPGWVKTVAERMHLAPVICVKPNGKVGVAGCLFGRHDRIARFARYVAARMETGSPVHIAIGQATCPEDADFLAECLREQVERIETLKICPLGTAIGVHGGPGTLIVSFRNAISAEDLAVGFD